MANTIPAVVARVAVSPIKAPKKPIASKGADKKPKKPSTHPPVSDMVLAAINALKERNGSSLQAIKKYIAANYLCDVAKLAPFVKKALKSGVEKGKLLQTKGTGASGSFKVKADARKPAGEKKVKKPKKEIKARKPADKGKVAKKSKATAAKKADEKKAPTKSAKKATGVKKAAASKQKATKPSKTAAKKPKTPKPKKAAPVKKAAPKKVAAKK